MRNSNSYGAGTAAVIVLFYGWTLSSVDAKEKPTEIISDRSAVTGYLPRVFYNPEITPGLSSSYSTAVQGWPTPYRPMVTYPALGIAQTPYYKSHQSSYEQHYPSMVFGPRPVIRRIRNKRINQNPQETVVSGTGYQNPVQMSGAGYNQRGVQPAPMVYQSSGDDLTDYLQPQLASPVPIIGRMELLQNDVNGTNTQIFKMQGPAKGFVSARTMMSNDESADDNGPGMVKGGVDMRQVNVNGDNTQTITMRALNDLAELGRAALSHININDDTEQAAAMRLLLANIASDDQNKNLMARITNDPVASEAVGRLARDFKGRLSPQVLTRALKMFKENVNATNAGDVLFQALDKFLQTYRAVEGNATPQGPVLASRTSLTQKNKNGNNTQVISLRDSATAVSFRDSKADVNGGRVSKEGFESRTAPTPLTTRSNEFSQVNVNGVNKQAIGMRGLDEGVSLKAVQTTTTTTTAAGRGGDESQSSESGIASVKGQNSEKGDNVQFVKMESFPNPGHLLYIKPVEELGGRLTVSQSVDREQPPNAKRDMYLNQMNQFGSNYQKMKINGREYFFF